jgi:hypothetical protein
MSAPLGGRLVRGARVTHIVANRRNVTSGTLPVVLTKTAEWVAAVARIVAWLVSRHRQAHGLKPGFLRSQGNVARRVNHHQVPLQRVRSMALSAL